jgi:hypothetical protein
LIWAQAAEARKRLLIDDQAPAATTGTIGEQEVVEAMSRPPRREFDEAIPRQGDGAASGLMVRHELGAVGELLVGIAQRDGPNWIRGPALLQSGFEPLPRVRVDADGEQMGVEEPTLPLRLSSHLDAARQNRALEARAVQALA